MIDYDRMKNEHYQALRTTAHKFAFRAISSDKPGNTVCFPNMAGIDWPMVAEMRELGLVAENAAYLSIEGYNLAMHLIS